MSFSPSHCFVCRRPALCIKYQTVLPLSQQEVRVMIRNPQMKKDTTPLVKSLLPIDVLDENTYVLYLVIQPPYIMKHLSPLKQACNVETEKVCCPTHAHARALTPLTRCRR